MLEVRLIGLTLRESVGFVAYVILELFVFPDCFFGNFDTLKFGCAQLAFFGVTAVGCVRTFIFGLVLRQSYQTVDVVFFKEPTT